MLKSTYKPSANLPPPLPPGWTEHKAPSGHTYYYNSETEKSTYERPVPSTAPAVPPPLPLPAGSNPHQQFFQYSSVPNLADPATANAFLAAYDPARQRQQQNQQQQHGRDGRDPNRPRAQPQDKPRKRVAIPGHEPWVLVYTKYGRRFAYNPVKNASYWRIPEKVMQGVIELDIKTVKDKAAGKDGADAATETTTKSEQPSQAQQQQQQLQQELEEDEEELGSDYEEVEVTDNEDEEGGDAEADDDEEGSAAQQRASKRQRTEEPPAESDLPAEFNEDDIAYQLQAMGADYGLDPGEYDDGDPESWPEGAEGETLTDEDARELFKDMLNDFGINPFSPWEKLIEEGKVFDDPRYTVMPTTKARREVWDEWSRDKIQLLREQREREAQSDPRIPYLAFLQDKATPKLYWPEFKRKYKRDEAMRTSAMADRDREKLYRDHIVRLKLSPDVLRKDLTALLRSVTLRDLNSQTPLENLPGQILTDVRYISLPPQTRDPLIAGYLQTLSGPPDANEADEDEASRRKKDERRKREKALEDRERVVAEEKRRAAKRVERGRAMLREEERELKQAMHVGKDGLRSHLLAAREKPAEEEGAAAVSTGQEKAAA